MGNYFTQKASLYTTAKKDYPCFYFRLDYYVIILCLTVRYSTTDFLLFKTGELNWPAKF